jgi:hypothetical protein
LSSHPDDKQINLSQEERIQLKKVGLGGVGKGNLLLENGSLIFEKKGGIFSSPHRLTIDIATVTSIKTDENNVITLKYVNDNEESTTAIFGLGNNKTVTKLAASISKTMEDLRQKAEKEAQRIKEAQKIKNAQVKQANYQFFLRTTTYYLWNLSSQLHSATLELTHENWERLEIQLEGLAKQAENLHEKTALDITKEVQELIGSVASRNQSLIFEKMKAVLKTISDSLQKSPPLSSEWSSFQPDDKNSLNWSHLRYMFLFAINCNSLSLLLHLNESKEGKSCISTLVKLSPILKDKFGLDLEKNLSQLSNSFDKNDFSSASEFLKRLQMSVESSLRTKIGAI